MSPVELCFYEFVFTIWVRTFAKDGKLYYLGGNEQSTHKFISEYLGKETLDTNTFGKSQGRSGSYTTNYQQTGRELLTPDEVRLLDNDYGLLFIRGERPVFDKKYNILRHPNVAMTHDGKAQEYIHGKISHLISNWQDIMLSDDEYELYSEEDLEEYFRKEDERKVPKKVNIEE